MSGKCTVFVAVATGTKLNLHLPYLVDQFHPFPHFDFLSSVGAALSFRAKLLN